MTAPSAWPVATTVTLRCAAAGKGGGEGGAERAAVGPHALIDNRMGELEGHSMNPFREKTTCYRESGHGRGTHGRGPSTETPKGDGTIETAHSPSL